MAGFLELEGPEIGSSPMLFEWPTACSWNTGMSSRGSDKSRVSKRSADVRDDISRMRGMFAAPGRVRSSSKGGHWPELDGGEAAERHALGADEQRSDHYAPPHKRRSNTNHAG